MRPPPPNNPSPYSTSTTDEDMPTVVTTNKTKHNKFPIRLNIRTRTREHDVNPFAVIKAFLTELARHDPTIKLGDHGEVFYSPTDFPTTHADFEAAFHGLEQGEETPAIKPFFSESVGNGPTVCTWCYLSSTFNFKTLHSHVRPWLVQKQVFMEPITNGYFGPRESIGYLTGLNLNFTFRSNLLQKIEDLLASTETAAQAEMDTITPTNPSTKSVLLPPRKLELMRTRFHHSNHYRCSSRSSPIHH